MPPDVPPGETHQAGPGGPADRLGLPIDRLPLAYLQYDADLRVRDWNAAAERLFGYTREEALGRDPIGLIVPLSAGPFVRDVIRRLRSGDMDAHSVNENRTKDGRTITCQWFNTPLVGPDGRFVGGISLAQDITERTRAEWALRDYAARLRDLSRRLIEVQEQERRRLACELHDEFGQLLTGISLNLRAIRAGLGAEAGPWLEESIAAVTDAIRRTRNFSLDLRPSILDDFGLGAALRWCAERQAQRAGLAVELVADLPGERLPAPVETACFRVAQEALTNVVRHAGARRVRIEARRLGGEVHLSVHDDGAGFDPAAATGGQGAGFGLRGMRERVELLGGAFAIDSQPGQGTTVSVRVPLAPAE